MVVPGIVCNDNDSSSTPRTDLPEVFEKRMERHSVKLFLLSLKNQFPIAEPDSSKIAHTPTGGMVQQYGVPLLRRHPHQTTGSILLEMDFIGRPKIDSMIGDEPSEFFYMPLEVRGQPGRSKGVVYADENQRI
jgi:hypothetical protein